MVYNFVFVLGFLKNGLHDGDLVIGYHAYHPPSLPTFSLSSKFKFFSFV